MAIKIKHKEVEFGVGDVVRVHQKVIEEGKKERVHVFEGRVIAIKNREEGKSFTVRRIGVQKIGIEMIFPIQSPLLEKVELKRKGMAGARRAKIYYTRKKSRREIEKIYTRSVRREKAKVTKEGKKRKKTLKS